MDILGDRNGQAISQQWMAHRDKRLWSDLWSQQCFCSRVSPSTSHVAKMNTFYCSFPVTELLFYSEDLDRHSYLLCPCNQSAYRCAPGPYLCSFSSKMTLRSNSYNKLQYLILCPAVKLFFCYY